MKSPAIPWDISFELAKAGPSSEGHPGVPPAPGLARPARVRRLWAREAVSEVFRVTADFDLPGCQADPADWLLCRGAVVVARGGEVVRRFVGIVTGAMEHASRSPRGRRVSVTLESPLAVLRLSRDTRVFVDRSVPEIVAAILEEAGLGGEGVRFALARAYAPRASCTQWDETCLDFVSRLLEDEGIFYIHDHGACPAIVFADSPAAWLPARAAPVPFRPESGLAAAEAVFELRAIDRARPARVSLRDYDFERPALRLEHAAHDGAPLGREHHEWGVLRHGARGLRGLAGERAARDRLDAFAAEAACVAGRGNCFGLAAGHVVTVCDAPDAAMDRAWMVRDVEHAFRDEGASGQRYTCSFNLLAHDAPYRPPLRTPPPRVAGPQIAHVTGPRGEEIHTDRHGRIKLRFPWDRRAPWDDRSSGWARVGQMQMSGAVAIPRVGWEVLVDFEDGDPDAPIVLGRLYDGSHPPPEPLPRRKTVSLLQSASSPASGGFNAIELDDAAGAELVRLHAQRDLRMDVANRRAEAVGSSSTTAIGGHRTLSVGGDEALQAGGSCDATVGGSQRIAVGGSRARSIGGDDGVEVGGSRSLAIGGDHTVTTPGACSTTAAGGLTETVGGSSVEVAGLAVSMAAAGAASVSVGGAKIEAAAGGATDFTLGAKVSAVGGARVLASGADVGLRVSGSKATTAGAAWVMGAGGDAELSAGAALSIQVGGAVAMDAANIVLSVGASSVTIASGGVVIRSPTIRLTATGPHAELSALVKDK